MLDRAALSNLWQQASGVPVRITTSGSRRKAGGKREESGRKATPMAAWRAHETRYRLKFHRPSVRFFIWGYFTAVSACYLSSPCCSHPPGTRSSSPLYWQPCATARGSTFQGIFSLHRDSLDSRDGGVCCPLAVGSCSPESN